MKKKVDCETCCEMLEKSCESSVEAVKVNAAKNGKAAPFLVGKSLGLFKALVMLCDYLGGGEADEEQGAD